MSNFIVSFRISSDRDYQRRYDSFVSKIQEVGGGAPAVWEETSSFFALEWIGSASDLCDKLYFATHFDASKDEMLVIDISKRKKAIKGPVKYLSTLERCLGF